MSGNRYMAVANLATHPAWECGPMALMCHLCSDFTTLRAAEYDRHFLAHEPTQEQCERWLSGRTYDRIGVQRGWFPGCEEPRCRRRAEFDAKCWKHRDRTAASL